jgi:hypothetical protein
MAMDVLAGLHPIAPRVGLSAPIGRMRAPNQASRPLAPLVVGPIFSASPGESAADVCQVLPLACVLKSDESRDARGVGFRRGWDSFPANPLTSTT